MADYKQQQKEWEKRRREILRLFRKHGNRQTVATELGITRQRVGQVLRKMGIVE